jgi:hypothetical protein
LVGIEDLRWGELGVFEREKSGKILGEDLKLWRKGVEEV